MPKRQRMSGGGVMKDRISKWLGFSERESSEEVRLIPVDAIAPSPYQPRAVFDDERLEELCDTIRVHGVIQPILVRPRENGFELIAGERRLRAVKKLGMDTIPAIVREMGDPQAASVALIENLQREGLTPIEEAVAYQKLMELHGLTQESLAQRLGKSQSTIANKLRLLQLPEPVRQALLDRQITERHARALLALDDEQAQLQVLREILQKNWSVQQTESRVKFLLETGGRTSERRKRGRRQAFAKDVRIALNTIRQSVDMVSKTGLPIRIDEHQYEDRYEIIIQIAKRPPGVI